MDRADLQALITLLRENGVTYYESGGTKLVLGPAKVAPPAAAGLSLERDETQEDRLDRLAYGRLFAAQGVTRG